MIRGSALALMVSDTPAAREAGEVLAGQHEWAPPEQADTMVVVGGDGFLLHVLHQMLDADRLLPVYGLNRGTVGFLMNRYRPGKSVVERVARATAVSVAPLVMRAVTQSGQEHRFHAINEVSLLRETRETAKIEIRVNGKVRMGELAGDGVLVATPAGSTAYNMSVNGPILPLGSRMLAMTPISPFRPRRWRGAILPDSAKVSFHVLEQGKRPVAVVADQKEVRDIRDVHIEACRKHQLTLLFDRGSSLEERIFSEQFLA